MLLVTTNPVASVLLAAVVAEKVVIIPVAAFTVIPVVIDVPCVTLAVSYKAGATVGAILVAKSVTGIT